MTTSHKDYFAYGGARDYLTLICHLRHKDLKEVLRARKYDEVVTTILSRSHPDDTILRERVTEALKIIKAYSAANPPKPERTFRNAV